LRVIIPDRHRQRLAAHRVSLCVVCAGPMRSAAHFYPQQRVAGLDPQRALERNGRAGRSPRLRCACACVTSAWLAGFSVAAATRGRSFGSCAGAGGSMTGGCSPGAGTGGTDTIGPWPRGRGPGIDVEGRPVRSQRAAELAARIRSVNVRARRMGGTSA
jgi:hypothetical protein